MTTPAYLTNCEQRIIDLSAGVIDYLWVDYDEKRKQDISADPAAISLGTWDAPGTWHNADIIQTNGAVWKMRAALLLGAGLTYPVGIYWAWIRVTDAPSVLIQRADNMFVSIT